MSNPIKACINDKSCIISGYVAYESMAISSDLEMFGM